MERPAWAPQGIDISVPSVSRIYDYYLGGSHNFEVDREAAREAMRFMPGLPKIMQANRAFMRRAVRFAVAEGITQFLDIGSGIPTFGNVHEVAQSASPEARVLYVDHDPVAVAHSRAVLEGNELRRDSRGRPAQAARHPRRPRDGPTPRPVTAGGAPPGRRTALRRGPGRPVRRGGRAARRARPRQPPRPHPRLLRGHPAQRGRGRRHRGRLPRHQEPAGHALARGDRAVLRRVRRGGARAGLDAAVATGERDRPGRSVRLLRASPVWGARREHPAPGAALRTWRRTAPRTGSDGSRRSGAGRSSR